MNFSIGLKNDITCEKKHEIAALLKGGRHTALKIVKICNVSRSKIDRLKRTVIIEGTEGLKSSRIGKCGQKRKTGSTTDRYIQRNAVLDRFLNPFQHARILNTANINISHMTVRRRLKEMGFRSIRPGKKPRLTSSMRQKRLQWAREHEQWTLDDWRRVCFSDESHFVCHDSSKLHAWHTRGRQRPFRSTEKYPQKVLVWSVISNMGCGALRIVDGTVNAEKYVEIIKDHLIPQLQEWFPEGDGIFMQDGAPCHKARSITKLLEDNCITVLKWPGNSPDLNPIETTWAIIKRRLQGQTIQRRTDMVSAIIDA